MRGRLLVDLTALSANYQSYCAISPGVTGAVVKADAYGMGLEAVAPALRAAGCDTFFVAIAEEGERLRSVVPDARIFVFEGATPQSAAALAAADLIPVINHSAQLSAWQNYAANPVAVHVDTGMGRLGFAASVQPDELSGFTVAMLLTHLACADTPEHPQNAAQLAAFREVARRFPDVPTSIGSSAGISLGADYCGDVARPGIGLYGGAAVAAGQPGAACVATLQGPVLQVREHAPGVTLGYGASYITRSTTRVATVGLGYADGVPRLLSNCGEVAVAGRRCPIVGRVSMDLTLVDVTGVTVGVGDWVEFFGATVAVHEVAAWAQTITYEVLASVSPRVERRYSTGG